VKRYDPKTADCMISYLDRFVKILESPMDIIMLFNPLSVGQQHHLNRALRSLFNFCEIMGFEKARLDALRKAIPKDKTGIDLWVPEEDLIVDNLHRLNGLIPKYRAAWSLCLDSGIRYVEAVNLINGFSERHLQKMNDFYRYEIGMFRESKTAYYAYFTDHTLSLIRDVGIEKINASNHNIDKRGYVAPKYLRKFAFDKMISLEIPESVADFIEGRVPKRIGAKHYMALMRQADKFYGRYGEYVTKLRN